MIPSVVITLLTSLSIISGTATHNIDNTSKCTAGPVVYLAQPKYSLLAGGYMVYPAHCLDNKFIDGQQFFTDSRVYDVLDFPHLGNILSDVLDVRLIWLGPEKPTQAVNAAGFVRPYTTIWELNVNVLVSAGGVGKGYSEKTAESYRWRAFLDVPIKRGDSGTPIILSDGSPVGMLFDGNHCCETSDFADFYSLVEVLKLFGLDTEDYN